MQEALLRVHQALEPASRSPHRAPSWPPSRPAWPSTSCGPRGPARALRRRVAARADHHRRTTTRRGTPSSPTRCRWPCSCCSRACRPSSAPRCCCTTCSATATRRSPPSSGRARTTSASSPRARDATSSSGGPASRRRASSATSWPRGSSRPSEHGDLAGLEALLAADVVLTGDGGGKVPALARPLRGRSRIARTCSSIPSLARLPARCDSSRSTAVPARCCFDAQQRLIGVMALDIAGDQITQHPFDRQPGQARSPQGDRRRRIAAAGVMTGAVSGRSAGPAGTPCRPSRPPPRSGRGRARAPRTRTSPSRRPSSASCRRSASRR